MWVKLGKISDLTPHPFQLWGYSINVSGGRWCGWHQIQILRYVYLGTHYTDFSAWSSMELPWRVVVQRHGQLPIWPTWAYPWAIKLSNMVFRLGRTYITLISSVSSYKKLFRHVIVRRLDHLLTCPIQDYKWGKYMGQITYFRNMGSVMRNNYRGPLLIPPS